MKFFAWRELSDSEFTAEVPYPTFAKAMMGYALKMRTYVKCTLVALSQREDVNRQREAADKRVADLKKALQEYRDDTKRMAQGIFDMACELRGSMTGIDILRDIKEAKDLKEEVRAEAKAAMEDTLVSSYRDYEASLLKEIASKMQTTCIKTAQTMQKYGIPSERIFGGPPALLSKEEVEEDKKVEETAPVITSKKATRQLKAAQEMVQKKEAAGKVAKLNFSINFKFD